MKIRVDLINQKGLVPDKVFSKALSNLLRRGYTTKGIHYSLSEFGLQCAENEGYLRVDVPDKNYFFKVPLCEKYDALIEIRDIINEQPEGRQLV